MKKTDRKRYLSFFQNSYDSCRQAFNGQAMRLREKKNGVLFSSIKLPSDPESGLFIDWCLVPPSGLQKNLLSSHPVFMEWRIYGKRYPAVCHVRASG
jgi:hypothetical protein